MTEGAQSATRVLQVLEAVGDAPDGVRVSAVADELGLAAPTAHRLLQSLVATGFASQDPDTRLYHAGPTLRRIALRAGPDMGLRNSARPHLQQLQDATDETVFLSATDGLELVYLECFMPQATVRMTGAPGMRIPFHATSQGKAMLAFLPSGERARVLDGLDLAPFTDRTVIDRAGLDRELAQVRLRGYAVNDEELEAGVRSVAAPILDDLGEPVAVVCVGAPAFRAPLRRIQEELAPAVIATAGAIARDYLGTEQRQEARP